MVSISVRVGPKGQLVIPKVFRDEYDLAPGDVVAIKGKDNKLFIEKSKDPVAALAALAERVNFRGRLDFRMLKERHGE